MNEACLNLLGVNIADPEGHKFAIKVLDFMRNKITEFQEETGNLYNLEATPAESTAYRLAKIDKKKYPDIIVANEFTSYKETGIPYYTNSTHLPVDYTDDLFFTLKHQEPLQSRYTGGTVLHVYLDEPIDKDTAKLLIKKMVHGFRIPYYSISPRFSICPVHGYIPGWVDKCPY
jgi:ribonucleoside-triphosphate reductase